MQLRASIPLATLDVCVCVCGFFIISIFRIIYQSPLLHAATAILSLSPPLFASCLPTPDPMGPSLAHPGERPLALPPLTADGYLHPAFCDAKPGGESRERERSDQVTQDQQQVSLCLTS